MKRFSPGIVAPVSVGIRQPGKSTGNRRVGRPQGLLLNLQGSQIKWFSFLILSPLTQVLGYLVGKRGPDLGFSDVPRVLHIQQRVWHQTLTLSPDAIGCGWQ